jgi:CBS domain containing-hemolysin-like protein
MAQGGYNDRHMTTQVIILLVLLLLSGLFSSAETAFFSISRTRSRHLAKTGDPGFRLIEQMKADPHRLLSTLLIGNNLVNIGASALATSLAIRLFPNYAVGLAIGVMTLLILVFGEVWPKSVAARNNLMIARMTVYPIFWLSRLFFPIIVLLQFIPRLTGKIERPPAVTEEELMTFVEAVEEEGEIKEEEKELIHNIFELDDTYTSEIMTPRADMFVIDINQPLALDAIAKSGFTRIPVIDGDIDHVIGIINVKDIFMHLAMSNGEVNVRQLMRKPYFVPEHKKVDRILHQFRKRRQHMAIVVDEHGGVAGLITMEDTLEELVGEIADETDEEESHVIDHGNGHWIVMGKADVEEVNEKIPMSIPDLPEYETFSGYILHAIGRIPEEKERIDLNGFCITVEEKDGNRINKYSVKPAARETGEAGGAKPAT